MRAARVITALLISHPISSTLTSRSFAKQQQLFAATAMSTTTTPPIRNNVRVVSYNLLSSKLARPSHFTRANPDHLEYEYRLPLILGKLDEAMNQDFGGVNDGPEQLAPPPTIFCLQEVCYPFASALHTFFAQRGYHFVTGLYGRPFNGFMGVGIAYPLKDFDTLKVDVCRLSDERAGGWPRENIEEEEKDGNAKGLGNIIQKFTKTFESIAAQTIFTINKSFLKTLGYTAGDKAIDPWEMSEKRFNVLLTVVLRFRSGESSTFSISNYHMPCAFYAPAVMNIHTEMVASRVQQLALESWRTAQGDESTEEVKEDGVKIPYILAGDFNILPDSPQYKIFTTGKLDKSDPTYPPTKHGMEWKIKSVPMDSAYALKDESGSEPEFTNYAHVKDDPEPFIGTLDYIFLSQKGLTSSSSGGKENGEWWKVHGVQKLPGTKDSGGPFPNEKEPSDHYLISADLELAQNLD